MANTILPVKTLNTTKAGVLARKDADGIYTILDDHTPVAVKPDTVLVMLMPDEQVTDPDGTPLPPTNKYWRTADSIDPYHIILDI